MTMKYLVKTNLQQDGKTIEILPITEFLMEE